MNPWVWVLLLTLLGTTAHGDEKVTLRVAAASSLHHAAEALGDAFARVQPGVSFEFSYAASGNLVAQVRHGAPFDVLLAADLTYPAALIKSGDTIGEKPVTYAFGQLVLWPQPKSAAILEALQNPSNRRLAIAHPDIAPYGYAARAWLTQHGIWEAVAAKIVTADNVAQCLQFVESGHADFGFVAASLLVAHPDLGTGKKISVPPELLAHGAIGLRRSAHPERVGQFLDWLESEEARKILVEHGYRVP